MEDLLSVTETCRQFYQICQKKSIADQFLVRVTTANQKLLKNASRNFNYRFIFETLFHFNQFCLQNIQELFMENIKTINFFLLVQTIHKIHNLKKLVIKDCDFKTLDDFVIVNEKKVIESKLSLSSLVLHSNRMDNGQLGYLLSPITDLICFDYSAYEQSGNENKSLGIDFLCNPKFSSSLKELTLRSEGCDLDPIFKTNHFNLKKFSFFCRRPTVNSNIVETFLTSQTNLNYLALNFAPNNYKLLPKMLTVCRRLEKLNYFSFNFGNQPIKCSDDLECIWKLKGLELTFVNTSFFTALEKESKVTELHLSIVSLTCFCNSLKFWPNLIYLFLSKAVFTDDYYQAIFEHLLQLRELRIFNSYLMVSSLKYIILYNSLAQDFCDLVSMTWHTPNL